MLRSLWCCSTMTKKWQARPGMKLSDREIECVMRLAYGKHGKEISEELGIAESTYHTHMSRVVKKLGASGHTHAAVIFALQQFGVTRQ